MSGHTDAVCVCVGYDVVQCDLFLPPSPLQLCCYGLSSENTSKYRPRNDKNLKV